MGEAASKDEGTRCSELSNTWGVIHMTRTKSVRSAAILLGTFVGLTLLGAGLVMAPAEAQKPKEVMQAAARDFEKVTLPTLIKMEPLIEKPAAERLTAYKALKLDDTTCYSAIGSGYRADQVAAESAARICVELASWLGGSDVDACFFGGWDSLAATSGDQEQPDARIEKNYRERRIKEMHDRLQTAAGCAKKDKAYWAGRAIETYHSVAGGPKALPDGKVELSNATSEAFLRCDRVGYLAGKDDVSKVAGAAIHGCAMLGSYLHGVITDLQWTCNELKTGLNTVLLNPGNDIFEAERPKMKASLDSYYAALKCDPGATAAKIADGAATEPAPTTPSAPSRTEQANALIGMINGEQQNYNTNVTYAKNWYDRGETAEACRYYQKQLHNAAALKADYIKLGDVLGTTEYRDKVAQYEEEQRIIYDNESDDCREAGVILSY